MGMPGIAEQRNKFTTCDDHLHDDLLDAYTDTQTYDFLKSWPVEMVMMIREIPDD